MAWRVAEARGWAARELRAAGVRPAGREAGWLLEHVLGPGARLALVTDGDRPLTARLHRRLESLVRRRADGEPLQYVLGSAPFLDLELAVGPGVLIPRPETERLVELAVPRCRPGRGAVCDLCTGSGAVALALARRLPAGTPVYGTDLSAAALAYARRNRRRLGVRGLRLLRGDLFAPLPRRLRLDLVTANPPYVSPVAYARLARGVRDYEPRLALWAADRGLALVRRIAAEARPWLVPGGWVLCEIGDEQGPAARQCFTTAGYATVDVHRDLAGHDRVLAAQAP